MFGTNRAAGIAGRTGRYTFRSTHNCCSGIDRGIRDHVKSLVARAGCALVVVMPWLALMAQSTQKSQATIGALEQQIQKHLQEQKPELAIPLLREVVSLDPKNINAQANLGVLLFFQGNN